MAEETELERQYRNERDLARRELGYLKENTDRILAEQRFQYERLEADRVEAERQAFEARKIVRLLRAGQVQEAIDVGLVAWPHLADEG